MATNELIQTEQAPRTAGAPVEHAPARIRYRRPTRLAEDLGALAVGAVVGVVVGSGLVVLVAWLVA